MKRAFVRDEETMRPTERDWAIYMLKAWDLNEVSMRFTRREVNIYINRSLDRPQNCMRSNVESMGSIRKEH